MGGGSREKITFSVNLIFIASAIALLFSCHYLPWTGWGALFGPISAVIGFGSLPFVQRSPHTMHGVGAVFSVSLCLYIFSLVMTMGAIQSQIVSMLVLLALSTLLLAQLRAFAAISLLSVTFVLLCWRVCGSGGMPHAALFSNLPDMRLRAVVELIILAMVSVIGVGNSVLSNRSYVKAVAAREKAERASASKTELFAVMSHEIRTPLSAIVSLVQNLALSETDLRRRVTIDVIDNAARQLETLLADMADVSRAESGALLFDEKFFDPGEQIWRSVLLFRNLADKKKLLISCNIDRSCDRELFGDPSRISQIINNMLGNAIRMADSGVVVITARVAAESASRSFTVEVANEGAGISAGLQSKIFQRFEQGESSSKILNSDAELGLVISRLLARQMGGDVTFESRMGEGSRFTCRLVLRAPEAIIGPNAEVVGSAPDSDAAAISHFRVLVADDNEDNRCVVRAVLGPLGEINYANNGSEVLHSFVNQHFDLVLMGMNIPEIHCLEAIRRIRKFEFEQRRRPCLIASIGDCISEERKASALAAGADYHISMPFRSGELLGLARRAADRRSKGFVSSPKRPFAYPVLRLVEDCSRKKPNDRTA